MAAPKLVDSDMEIGMEAAKALWKDSVLRPTAVLWAYDEDVGEWRFMLGTEDVRHRGPQASYLRVRNILKSAKLLEKLPLRRVVVADPSSPSLATLSGVVQTPGNELAGLGFYDCTFNGMTVQGLHIYHLNNTFQPAGKAEQPAQAAAQG